MNIIRCGNLFAVWLLNHYQRIDPGDTSRILRSCPILYFLLSISCLIIFSFISGRKSTPIIDVVIRNIGNFPACQVSVTLNLLGGRATFMLVDKEQWSCGEFGYSNLTCQPAQGNRHYGAIGPGQMVRNNQLHGTPVMC